MPLSDHELNARLSPIQGYSEALQQQVKHLIVQGRLSDYLHEKYPQSHCITTDKALRDYAQTLKNRHMKQGVPLSKVGFDPKIQLVNQALGIHARVSRVQGTKLKSKRELKISTLFKQAPEPFLNMIVVHELAHLRVSEHNKAFYQLCHHMLPDYAQLEFDTRLYVIQLDLKAGTVEQGILAR